MERPSTSEFNSPLQNKQLRRIKSAEAKKSVNFEQEEDEDDILPKKKYLKTPSTSEKRHSFETLSAKKLFESSSESDLNKNKEDTDSSDVIYETEITSVIFPSLDDRIEANSKGITDVSLTFTSPEIKPKKQKRLVKKVLREKCNPTNKRSKAILRNKKRKKVSNNNDNDVQDDYLYYEEPVLSETESSSSDDSMREEFFPFKKICGMNIPKATRSKLSKLDIGKVLIENLSNEQEKTSIEEIKIPHQNMSIDEPKVDDSPLKYSRSFDSLPRSNESFNLVVEEDEGLYSDTSLTKEGVEIYKITNGELLHMSQGANVYFYGALALTVIEGIIEVNGYNLEVGKEYEMYSPRGSSFLYIKNCDQGLLGHKKDTLKDVDSLKTKLVKSGMELKEASRLIDNIASSEAVVICTKLVNKKIEFIEKHMSQQLFPMNDLRLSIRVHRDDWNVLKPNNQWDELVENKDVENSKTLLCGGKGVGKSTLLRYLCNKLLIKYGKVFVIDLDPGQPEFTIPGCISATVVKEPLFGPNYTHLKQPEYSIHVGLINIALSPPTYMKCVKELLHKCADITGMPIIINCMGFSRGIGTEIMASIIHMVEPQRVVEIISKKFSKNFPINLSSTNIQNMNLALGECNKNLKHYDINRINCMSDANKGWDVEPRHIREMCVLAYFSQSLPNNVLSLTDGSVPLFEANIELLTCPDGLPVIQAQLVVLCEKIKDTDLHRCYGWGIVRSINRDEGTLVIITPFKIDHSNVDHLILSPASIPASIYMTPDDNYGLIPYVQEGTNKTSFQQFVKRSQYTNKK